MKNRKKYTMDAQLADSTLKNVFKACNIKIQTESVRQIQEKHNKEAHGYWLLMVTALAALVMLLITPFCFRPSPATVTAMQSQSSSAQVYQHHMEDGIFYITFSGSGIEYSRVYLVDSTGKKQKILSYNTRKSTIAFPYSGQELNIYVPEDNGSVLHLLLSPRKGSENTQQNGSTHSISQ